MLWFFAFTAIGIAVLALFSDALSHYQNANTTDAWRHSPIEPVRLAGHPHRHLIATAALHFSQDRWRAASVQH